MWTFIHMGYPKLLSIWDIQKFRVFHLCFQPINLLAMDIPSYQVSEVPSKHQGPPLDISGKNCASQFTSATLVKDFVWLVVEPPTPLEINGLRQLGWWHSIPNCFWKVNPNSMVPVTTNQWLLTIMEPSLTIINRDFSWDFPWFPMIFWCPNHWRDQISHDFPWGPLNRLRSSEDASDDAQRQNH